MSKTITIQDVIDAAKKNGFPWGRGEYIVKGNSGNVTRACVFGQIGLNLNVAPDDIVVGLRQAITSAYLNRHENLPSIMPDVSDIWLYNDQIHASGGEYTDVIAFVENILGAFKDVEFEISEAYDG